MPPSLDAQFRRGRQAEAVPRWAPISIGAKVGWDSQANATAVGGHVRIPVVRDGTIELYPSAEAILLTGTKEYQYNLDAAWVPGGVGGVCVCWCGRRVGETLSLAWMSGIPDKRSSASTHLEAVKRILDQCRSNSCCVGRSSTKRSNQPNSASIGLNFPLWRAASER